jgi:RND family efflux transporter MFP subunit
MRWNLFFWVSSPHKRASTCLLAATMLMMVAAGCGGERQGQEAGPDNAELHAVRVVAVHPEPIRQTIDYVGTVHAASQVSITSAVPGTLAKLDVDEGDRVERGQVLGRIDAPDVRARRDRVRAELERASVESAYMCDRLDTDRKLAEAEVIQRAQLDASQKNCDSARAAVAAAKAQLQELQATLAKTTVTAPSDAEVLQRMAEPGEEVGPGRALVILGGGAIEARVPVVEADLHRGLQVGTPARVSLPGSAGDDSRVIETEVVAVAPLATGPGRSSEVTVALPDAFETLRQGMSLDVSFVLDEVPNATAVPLAAVRSTAQGDVVFVIEEGQARQLGVERGIVEAGRVAVEPQLAAGARVAITNIDTLYEGARVYPVEVPGGGR